MAHTCHHCGKPIPGEEPGGGICPSCVWKMTEDATQTVVTPVPLTGLPEVEGHIILHELARGGMGIVYKARQLDPQREVALKMLLPLDERREDILQRFRVEVHARSPNWTTRASCHSIRWAAMAGARGSP